MQREFALAMARGYHPYMRALSRHFLAPIGILLTLGFFYHLFQRADFFEPDRLYHLALLREMRTQGAWVLHEWKQAPLLGWGEYFSDKEFLFHFLLSPFERIGGEAGVAIAALSLSALLVWLPFYFFPQARIFALLCSLFVFLNPTFLFRFALLRPHILAALLFTVLLCSFRSKKPHWPFLCAFLYALAYHAFYLPIAAALLCISFGFLAQRFPKKWEDFSPMKQGLAALLGIGMGSVVNPYFPSNLVRGLQHLSISLRARSMEESLGFRFGEELHPFPIPEFVRHFGILFFVVACGWIWLMRAPRKNTYAIFLSSLALFLFALSALSPRTLEFAAPLSVLAIAFSFGAIPKGAKAALLALLFISALPVRELFVEFKKYESPPPAEIAALLATIPPGHSRVFHSNWGLGPYILYFRPDLEITEALDPTFLLFSNPKLARLLPALTAGMIPQPLPVIRKEFGAKYALLEQSPLLVQVEQSGAAKFLARTPDHSFYLFQLEK